MAPITLRCLSSLLVLTSAPAPQAPGNPRVAPRVVLASVAIRGAILENTAATDFELVFRNEGGGEGEADVLLPIGPDAIADRFSLRVDGKELAAEVLPADRSRAIYEEIVRRRRDPGLLEYAGRGLLRARLFPILPNKEVRATLHVAELLRESGGLHEYTIPLRALSSGTLSAQRVSFDVSVRSARGVRNVFSPTAGVDVRVADDLCARVSWEGRGDRSAADPKVFFGLGGEEVGVRALSFRREGQAGWFLLTVTPRPGLEEDRVLRKCLVITVDVSGSMQGEKLEQAKGALRSFLAQLRGEDTFDIVAFSTEARSLFSGPRAASPENLEAARQFVAGLQAAGGTNFADALDRSLGFRADGDRVPMVLFVTDGLPTVGSTDEATLLALANARNTAKARVFVFGVGSDVNTRLLDRIAEDSRGSRDYVGERESIEVKVSALLAKISSPVMTDVKLASDAFGGFDLHPARMPDLFRGERLVVLGRYAKGGRFPVRLQGRIAGKEKEHVAEITLEDASVAHPFVPALWAQRRIGFLLDEIRLKGQNRELADEVVRLGREHGVVTPWTSQLVLEDGVVRLGAVTGGSTGSDDYFLGRAVNGVPTTGKGGAGVRMPGPCSPSLGGLRGPVPGPRNTGCTNPGPSGPAPYAPAAGGPATGGPATGGPATGGPSGPGNSPPSRPSGAEAVELSVALEKIREGTTVQDLVGADAAVQRVQGKVFFRVADVWVDGALTGKSLAGKDKIKVKAFSDEYFALLRERPELQPYFALGDRVILVLGERLVEVEGA